MLPLWVLFGIVIGLFGFYIDQNRTPENFIGSMLLGLAGALQGYLVSTILETLPVIQTSVSPTLYIFLGGFLLLALGKITKKAF